MARAYYSTVFEQTTEQIWSVIRDFGNYQVWLEEVSESHIEAGKSGKEVGAIRSVRIGDTTIRQRLLALSDHEHFQTYEFCDQPPYPVRNYEATLRVTPIIDGNTSFIEWWATFDGEASEDERWTVFFTDSFAKWLEALRAHLTR